MLCPSEISKGETNGVEYVDRTVAVRNRRRWHKIQAVKLPGKRVPCFFERIQKTLRIARKSGVLCETGQKKIPESVSLFLVSRNVFGFVAAGFVS